MKYTCNYRNIICLIFFFTFALVSMSLSASGKKRVVFKKTNKADSIMRNVIKFSQHYPSLISSYDAEVYIKGKSEILKKNMLFHYIPEVYTYDKKNKVSVFELKTDLKYTSPNTFVHDIKAVNGSSAVRRNQRADLLRYININVYNPVAYEDEVIMPLNKGAFKLYRFTCMSEFEKDGYTIYQIRFDPKIWSQNLIRGNLYVVKDLWTLSRIETYGRREFAIFNLDVDFGMSTNTFLLPQKSKLNLRYVMLGNIVETNYLMSYKYTDVVRLDKEEDVNLVPKDQYDLSDKFTILTDSVPIIEDSLYWSKIRPEPLDAEEVEILQREKIRKAEISVDSAEAKTKIGDYLKVTDKIINTSNFDYQSTSLKYSGILNPAYMGYSKVSGISIRQFIRVTKRFENDKAFVFRPDVGYVFGRKELFFRVIGDWLYKPERFGRLTINIGNGNRIHSTKIVDQVRQILNDTQEQLPDLDRFNYTDYYADLKNAYELFNGFELRTGIIYHKRLPINRVIDSLQVYNSDPDAPVEYKSIRLHNYTEFTPVLGFSWTPKQYYRMMGHRKEYVRSKFPTLSVEYALGIPRFLGADGDYSRLEFDLQQTIGLDRLRFLSYRVGGGWFLNQKSEYFSDFRYFARRNFPESWSDNIGGVFNLLESKWYNAADSYFQAHLMYQSPFLFFSRWKFLSKYISSERLYLSHLYMPVLKSYTEVGFGVGNYIFDAGVFVSFEKARYQTIGAKISLQLFH
ncbi:MAG: DUF5686 family protein [Tannerellaceae bacterium]